MLQTTVACIVIATKRREALLDEQILPSVVAQGFDEVVVIGDYHSGTGYRHLPFRPLTGSTIDAQFKRDIGAMATSSDWLCYLCDDHRLGGEFLSELLVALEYDRLGPTDVLVPARYCVRDGESIRLNMGHPGYLGHPYCGGHAGVFHRSAIQQVPFSVAPWHPNWDYYHSRMLTDRGYCLHYSESVWIEDIDPDTPRPWT